MGVANNIYSNQYKIAKKLNDSFESYWSKSGITDSKTPVKDVVRSIFMLLDDDIRNKVDDDNYNQTILDRVEFRDLCTLVGKILEQYADV
jgi:hypothetical protein